MSETNRPVSLKTLITKNIAALRNEQYSVYIYLIEKMLSLQNDPKP